MGEKFGKRRFEGEGLKEKVGRRRLEGEGLKEKVGRRRLEGEGWKKKELEIGLLFYVIYLIIIPSFNLFKTSLGREVVESRKGL